MYHQCISLCVIVLLCINRLPFFWLFFNSVQFYCCIDSLLPWRQVSLCYFGPIYWHFKLLSTSFSIIWQPFETHISAPPKMPSNTVNKQELEGKQIVTASRYVFSWILHLSFFFCQLNLNFILFDIVPVFQLCVSQMDTTKVFNVF